MLLNMNMIISKLILKVWGINIKDLFENNKLIRMRIEFVILVPRKEWMKSCRIRSKFFKNKLKSKQDGNKALALFLIRKDEVEAKLEIKINPGEPQGDKQRINF